MSKVERNREWEDKEKVIRAYSVGVSVYYVVYSTDPEQYFLQYWPDERKKIETVSVIDNYNDPTKAIDELNNKVDEYRN